MNAAALFSGNVDLAARQFLALLAPAFGECLQALNAGEREISELLESNDLPQPNLPAYAEAVRQVNRLRQDIESLIGLAELFDPDRPPKTSNGCWPAQPARPPERSNTMMTDKLLIVDDQAELRRMLRIATGYGKYILFEADNGEDALAIAMKELPNVVLLDIMMPGDLNGLQVCEYIKQSPAMKGIYVILLTARGQADDIEAGRRAGADVYMIKPFSPLHLIEVIESRHQPKGEMVVVRLEGMGQSRANALPLSSAKKG
jgi:CheY-like chemotaxis protein